MWKEARRIAERTACVCVQCQMVLCPDWRLTRVPDTEADFCASSWELLSEIWVIGFCFGVGPGPLICLAWSKSFLWCIFFVSYRSETSRAVHYSAVFMFYCMSACTCTRAWRSEVDSMCLPRSFSTFFIFVIGSLTKACLFSYVDWPASLEDAPLASPALGLQLWAAAPECFM